MLDTEDIVVARRLFATVALDRRRAVLGLWTRLMRETNVAGRAAGDAGSDSHVVPSARFELATEILEIPALTAELRGSRTQAYAADSARSSSEHSSLA